MAWVNDMHLAIKNAMPNQKIYLVSAIVPYEGITNFVQDLHLAADTENVR